MTSWASGIRRGTIRSPRISWRRLAGKPSAEVVVRLKQGVLRHDQYVRVVEVGAVVV